MNKFPDSFPEDSSDTFMPESAITGFDFSAINFESINSLRDEMDLSAGMVRRTTDLYDAAQANKQMSYDRGDSLD